jgi:hypothetical protein
MHLELKITICNFPENALDSSEEKKNCVLRSNHYVIMQQKQFNNFAGKAEAYCHFMISWLLQNLSQMEIMTLSLTKPFINRFCPLLFDDY